MAAPLSAADLLAALRAEGCKVQEYRSWRTHRRPTSTGAFGPINGVMIHHTVTSGTDSSVALCYNGHSDLPGPLCHGVIAKDGTIYLVSAGRANHAGPGDDDVLRMVQNESYNRDSLLAPNEVNTDGNARFYGFECINLGNGKDPWPAAQRDAIVRASAAILRAYGGPAKGWTAKSVIGHKEWQPGKIDPRTGTGGVDVSPPVLRKLIDERLAHPASWTPGATTAPSKPATSPTAPKEDDMPSAKEIAAAVMEYQIDDPRTTGTKYVQVKDVLWWAGADAAQANAKVRDLEAQLAAVHAQLDRLLAANTQG
ncbi:peptidoglycan recognition family protein [Streptomyces sp. WAC08401]|uniref:peptidoglycan recognition protein family protein n=1 Tax=Streptomyces sp. WAC08401 TaxID=2487413 RepID=UPI000FB4CCC1|nr:peptidoglycan recognition family protein [Streptomyces sp. WAC08401]RSS11423.1 N-acetylmuramoyl-L-alanine amidase [Streptomyces sp. WAC08401]